MKRIASILLAAMLLSCSIVALAEGTGLGLTAGVKPATEITAAANAAVYDQLDFNDKQEYEFATRGLIAAPETLELKDENGTVLWSQDAFAFLDDYEEAPDSVNPSLWENTKTTMPTACLRSATASIRCAAMIWQTSPLSRATRDGSSLTR